MPNRIHPTNPDDGDALRRHLITEHDLAAADVPRTRTARDGVHDRIHDGIPVPGTTAAHRSDRSNEDIPAELAGAADAQVRRCADGMRVLTRQDPQLAKALVHRHCRDLHAALAAARDAGATDQETEAASGMTGEQLRDVVVALVNVDDARRLSARPIGVLLSRGRHALDITAADGRIWRVDVHDHPRTVAGMTS